MNPLQVGTWETVETRCYVWDAYNIIAEIIIDEVTFSTNITYCTWGLDLSGTLQEAGGVGGLLTETKVIGLAINTYYLLGDANGNVSEYVDSTGLIRGHYEYSPFGEIVVKFGDIAGIFTHLFSTKPYDLKTGYVSYQKRLYTPILGWLQRDRIGTQGGRNEYGTIGNNLINNWDYLGLTDINKWKKRILSSAEGHTFGCEEWKSHKEGFSGVANRSSYVRHFEIKSLGAVNMNKKLKRKLADELVSSIGIPNNDESTLWSMNFRETALYYTGYQKRKDSKCKSGCRYYIDLFMQVVVSEIRSKSGEMIDILIFTNAGNESKNKISQTSVHSIDKECVQ